MNEASWRMIDVENLVRESLCTSSQCAVCCFKRMPLFMQEVAQFSLSVYETKLDDLLCYLAYISALIWTHIIDQCLDKGGNKSNFIRNLIQVEDFTGCDVELIWNSAIVLE